MFHMQEALKHSVRKMILIVEDDEAIGTFLVQVLSQEAPYDVQLATSAHEALRIVREVTPDVFLLDYFLPSMSGLMLYDQLHAMKRLEAVPAIMMSAVLPPEQELKKRRIIGIHKPFDIDELLQTTEQVIA